MNSHKKILYYLITISSIALCSCNIFSPSPVTKNNIIPINQVIPICLNFPKNIEPQIPQKDPVSVDDYIQCGLFYDSQHKYKEAAESFIQAGYMISEKHNPLRQACFTASAVSYLLTGNTKGFLLSMHWLEKSYSSYQWIVESKQNPKLAVLNTLVFHFSRYSK